MSKGMYTDFSIASAKYLSKYTGIWLPKNIAEERQRKVTVLYMTVALLYGIYVNVMDIYHTWPDPSHCMFLILNATCISVTIIKMLILNAKRAEFAEVLLYAQRHFWHDNYDSEEQLIFSICVKYCTRFVMFAFLALPIALFGYVITPIIANHGGDKSERVLPFKMWVDWPLTETPYYELMFIFQVICIYLIGAAYICTDLFLCLFNLHAMCQFRILQYKMLNFWNVENKEIDGIMYTEHCYAALKKCIQYHQMVIKFCEKLEHLYTMSILVHMTVLSLLMGFDSYEILVVPQRLNKYVVNTLTVTTRTAMCERTHFTISKTFYEHKADVSPSMRIIFLFHMIGSLGYLCMLTYTCHHMMEESMNITTTIYLGFWNTLPMNKVGRSFRSIMKFIMIRSLKPCCLTVGGFFPVTMQTFTTLLSSTFSYYTLMRQSFIRNEEE